MSRIQHLVRRARRHAESRQGQRWMKALRAVFVVGVVVWLAYQLSGIGWGEVWASRPRTPWFYVIWLALYLQLPLVEALIYRTVWKVPFREILSPILRKRPLNQDLVSYSGEAYFFMWARRRLALSDRQIAGTLKDNAIASSLGTWTAAVLLVSVFLFTGQIVLTDLLPEQDPLYVTAGLILAAIGVAVGIRFRRSIFTLPSRTVLGLYGAHVGRFLLIAYVLQIVQWWVVLPDAPLSVWATMLAVITVVNRVPLLPARDLVGIGAILGMTELLAASSATIAAMLLMRSVLDKVFNLGLFAATYLLDRKQPRAAEHERNGEAPRDAAVKEPALLNEGVT